MSKKHFVTETNKRGDKKTYACCQNGTCSNRYLHKTGHRANNVTFFPSHIIYVGQGKMVTIMVCEECFQRDATFTDYTFSNIDFKETTVRKGILLTYVKKTPEPQKKEKKARKKKTK